MLKWILWGSLLAHSVEISGYFCHSDFTWNRFWRIQTFWNCRLFTISGALNFVHLVNFSLLKVQKVTKNQNLEPLNVFQMADFALLHSPKLISRKIWVAEDFLKFPHCGLWPLLFYPCWKLTFGQICINYRPEQPNWEYTIWKFYDFSDTQILREIN